MITHRLVLHTKYGDRPIDVESTAQAVAAIEAAGRYPGLLGFDVLPAPDSKAKPTETLWIPASRPLH